LIFPELCVNNHNTSVKNLTRLRAPVAAKEVRERQVRWQHQQTKRVKKKAVDGRNGKQRDHQVHPSPRHLRPALLVRLSTSTATRSAIAPTDMYSPYVHLHLKLT
jgi:hypothetical protein